MTRNASAGMTGLAAACVLTLTLAVNPVAATDEEAQKACEDKAEKHDPPLSSVDWEAFMADCLADATAAMGKEE